MHASVRHGVHFDWYNNTVVEGDCVHPWQFKSAVARHAPQFDGYDQHDAQELLQFVLDGLHEDVNKIKEKQYFDEKAAFTYMPPPAAELRPRTRDPLLRHESKRKWDVGVVGLETDPVFFKVETGV